MIDLQLSHILILLFSILSASAMTFLVARKEVSTLREKNATLEAENQQVNLALSEQSETLQSHVQALNNLSEEHQQVVLDHEKSKVAFAATKENLDEIKGHVERTESELKAANSEKNELSNKAASLATELQQKETLLQEQLLEIKERLAKSDFELKEANTAKDEISKQFASLESSLTEKEKSFATQQEKITEQEAHLRKEFENLANKIFEVKGKTFNEQSRQTINDLLHPFKQQMTDFKQKVEDIHLKDVQQQATLSKELKDLKELNLSMTEQAHDLATALQGQKKTQGNWGELILENILDSSGLIQGRDYEREVSFNTEEGRSRPDAIVYLPQGKHLIIDAKVSLNAYTRYINSEDETERLLALKEHVTAVSDRIKELSDRNYYQIEALNSPEMVFMFVPIESAFVEALKADESLFEKAIEQNVLVATPTTLLTSLNIVKQLWRFEDQNKHTAELADRAGKIYDKLNTFLGSMLGIGKQLDKAKEHYDKAFGQLYSGRGNLIKQANDFKKLGVSVKADLEQSIVEKAEMELDILEEPEVEEFTSDPTSESNVDIQADVAEIEESSEVIETDNVDADKTEAVESTES